MLSRISTSTVAMLFGILLFYSSAAAQITDAEKQQAEAVKRECTTPLNISTWLNCKVDEISAAKLQQRDPSKSIQLPSIADSTTTLVDTSEAPDVFGIALNLAGLSTGNDKDKKSSVSFTSTAYALYAAATQRDPLNPSLYVRHPNLRRFSFTFGQETPEDGTERSTILGTKILIINNRDASRPSNRALLRPVSAQLSRATHDFARVAEDIQTYLYEQLWQKLQLRDPSTLSGQEKLIDESNFRAQHLGSGRMTATLSLLTPDQLVEIDNIITNRIESTVKLEESNRRVIEEIRRAPQLAFIFQSKLRSADGVDEYRGGITFDYGVYRRINLTLNGTFDYLDSKAVGGDLRGGRFAGEANFQLTPDRKVFEGAGPWMFSASAEGKWMSNATPTYTGQLRLTIPVLDGIDFPLSVSVANHGDLINESHVRGRFGFSFDLPKLLKRLH